MKKKFIDYFMSIAELTAGLSYATRLKVGTVIVNPSGEQIMATGYNGMPAGWDNTCEHKEWMHNTVENPDFYSPEDIDEIWPNVGYSDIDDQPIGRYKLVTKPEVLHSEMNALMKVAKSTLSTKDAILISTHAPCIDCAKAIYQAGIKEVYYSNDYRSTKGIEFLKNGGVIVNRYSKE